ncbi:hypothetical protein [Tenacibaculum maritimum]|uniref:hypothetical protein n=1 Tax=Tenacibaculum maritimum TaxID=107401 RepID=UPI001E47C340|nr:hypothetical protein [Tenacibaculum maritimum]MCD9586203.1 hypothetical protein [Tenacibaculum maritimum]MCD9610680.1 hypothetical protein [Tenacibaculum maritimum]MCD9622147.1 hypothetical protein [Tenacibaculum maritimum]MCD9628581.1 hypothetical protein [Tenacibaculum maritimum]MCD9630060.1 hypothetical protein [Tenacibaculum maritimum]
MKVLIDDFIKEEINNYTKKIILNKIENKGKKQEEELIFNKYSLEMNFSKNIVVIYDDVFSEDLPLKICLKDFIRHLKNYDSEDQE